MPKILVLADEDDVGIRRLANRLEQRCELLWWRFGVAEEEVTADVSANGFCLGQPGLTLRSQDVASAGAVIYKRRWLQPRPLVRSRLNGEANGAFSEREWESLLHGVLHEQEVHSEAVWLNAPSAWARTANKLSLLLRAVEMGLPVPRFRISTPIRLPRDGCVSDVVTKAISANEEIEPERHLSTVRLRPHEAAELQGRQVTTPPFLQEYVKPVCEFRAYFVLGKWVTVRLKPSPQHVDIRHSRREEMAPELDRLPGSLEEGLSGLARNLGLNYCAFDLIGGVDGEIRLVDITPAGSWDYFETSSDPFLSNALADIIESDLCGHRERLR